MKPQDETQSDDVRRQTIEECAKVAEANMHSSVMPGHVGKNIAAEIRALQPQPNGGWQDISTAPKDKRSILVCHEGSSLDPYVSRWLLNAERWSHPFNKPINDPTHWQPLPAPPLPLDKGKGGSEETQFRKHKSTQNI